MRRGWLIVLILGVVAVVGWLGYSQVYVPSMAPTPTPQATQEAHTVIWASGKVVPKTWATLGFQISGRVTELPVSAGDTVAAGDVLARLDDAELADAVSAAQAAVGVAQADLAQLKAGPRPAEIDEAQAAVKMAEAGRDTAQAQLSEAQAKLDLLLAGPRSEELEAAAAAMLKADANLRLAQAAYDKIAWSGDVADTTEALDLESATLDYETAVANYKALAGGARAQEIDAARAVVAAAESQLAQAEAEIESARAGLAQRRAGATSQQIAAGEARVSQAQAQLDSALTTLNQAQLMAPFDGTVGEVYVHAGETVIAGQPQPIMIVGNISQLQVETTDLRETDVTQVAVGQPVDITLDALPDVLLKGHIASISPMASTEKGGVNYTTVIAFDDTDPHLRWGMTAYVNIVVQ